RSDRWFPTRGQDRQSNLGNNYGPFSCVCGEIENRKSKIENVKMAFSRTAALRYLRWAHKQNRLAHAYLISGSPGSGKRLLAAELANLVNGTAQSEVFSTKAREIFVAEPESKSRRIV